MPQGAYGTTIVASDTGTILYFGLYEETASSGMRGKSYLALLDPSGMVRTEVQVTVPGLNIARLASGDAAPPGVVLGDDGNFYIAGSNELVVISQGGDLLRRIPFDNPDPKTSATGVRVSAGLALIDLDRIKDHYVDRSYLVVETAGGGVVGLYKPSGQLKGVSDACLSPKRVLTFIQFQKGQTRLLTAPLQ